MLGYDNLLDCKLYLELLIGRNKLVDIDKQTSKLRTRSITVKLWIPIGSSVPAGFQTNALSEFLCPLYVPHGTSLTPTFA